MGLPDNPSSLIAILMLISMVARCASGSGAPSGTPRR